MGQRPWMMGWRGLQVRNGLAMARALDRIFVMPELVCICDRWFNLLPNCTSGEVRVAPCGWPC